MEFRSILSYFGTVLEIAGIVCILPVFIAWIYGENPTLFFITAVISFILGILLDRKFRKKELNMSSAMVLASLSFIVVSLIGSIPFLWNLNPLDAIFESVSGFTTTGMTTVKPESIPYSLVFYRSLTQWIGGLGIIVVFIYLIGSQGISSYYGKKPEDEGRKKSIIKRAMLIYGFLTFVGIVLLLLTGIGAFDSLATSLSAISTGGFSPKAASIAAYQSIWVELVVMLLMIIGATSFILLEGFSRGRFLDYVKSAEARIFWGLIVLFTILLSFAMFSLGEPSRLALFQTVSSLTTGGFTTLNAIPSGLVMILSIVLMIIGGFGASAAGGMKLARAGIMGKAFPWIAKKVTLPQEAIVPLKYDGRVAKDSEVTIVAVFTAIYVLFLFGSAILLSFMGYQPLSSLYQAASAQGNVGLSAIPMDTINPAAKVLLMVNMILGRLEIFPVLGFLYVLIKTRLGKKDIISG